MGDTIQNYSTQPVSPCRSHRAAGPHVDLHDAIRRLKEALPKIPNVVAGAGARRRDPHFNDRGPVLAVRPYCHTAHYWQVYFDTNKAIPDTFGAAGYPVPERTSACGKKWPERPDFRKRAAA